MDEENYKIVTIEKKLQSVKDGLCKYYFNSGKIKAEVYFSFGQESGHSKYYDEAGNLVREHYVFTDGSQYNVFNGDTVNRTDAKGLKQGKWISIGEGYRIDDEQEHDCNVLPDRIEYYKDGKPVGIWLEGSNDQFYGMDSTVLEWIDSIKAFCSEYSYGKLKATGYMLDQYYKIGHWKEYNIYPKKPYLEWEGDYIYSKYWVWVDRECKDGAWIHYKKNGKVKEIINYKNGYSEEEMRDETMQKRRKKIK